ASWFTRLWMVAGWQVAGCKFLDRRCASLETTCNLPTCQPATPLSLLRLDMLANLQRGHAVGRAADNRVERLAVVETTGTRPAPALSPAVVRHVDRLLLRVLVGLTGEGGRGSRARGGARRGLGRAQTGRRARRRHVGRGRGLGQARRGGERIV